MPTETLKEFLVRVGYKVDEPSERRFYAGIEGAALKANLLASALEGMARVAVEKIGETSDYLEKLGYMSARVATSAVHIRAFGQAFQQAGGETKQGLSVLEKFAHFMNVNVRGGAESLVKNVFTVRTEDANGIKREWADVLIDVSEQLAKLTAEDPNAGRAKAQVFANAVGLSYEDVQVMIQNITELKKAWREALASNEAAGIGPQMTAANAKFEQSLRDFWNRVDNMSVGGQGKLSEALIGPMETLDKWITVNEPALDDSLNKITAAVGRMIGAFVDDFAKVNWAGDTGEITSFTGAVVAFIDQIHGFIVAMEDLNERSKSWWIMRLFNRDVHLDANGQPEFLNDSGSAQPNWWQRNMPRILGGGGGTAEKPVGGWWTPERMKYAADYLVKNAGLTQMGAAGLVARWAAIESPQGPGSINPVSGAAGIAQGLGARRLGYTGTFDEQLANAARELNGAEKRAGDILRNATTPAEASRGASVFERAEGYNPVSGTDAFTSQTPVPKVYGQIYGNKAAPTSTAPPTAPEHPTWFAPKGQQPWEMPSSRWDALNKALPTVDPNTLAPSAASSVDTSKVVTSHVTNNVTVNAPDPHSAAAMVGLHLDRNAHDQVTNLQGVVQ